MSADQISRLHEQASEYYLNGDYTAALASWREVLALDPGNEEAREGARMASQFAAEQTEPTPTAPPADSALEHDVDLGLKVLDSLGTQAAAPVAFDLGDPSQVDAAPVMSAVEEGWEPAAKEDVSFGLAPASATTDGSGAPTAAAVELRRRVDDLLVQARSKIEAGERDEALAILARVSILDEENPEAVTIRAELEASGRTDLDRIEQAIIEGVSALESDRLDDAERLFQEVLSLSPEHREALHYMEQVASRRAAAANPPPPSAPQEDLLDGSEAFGAPSGPSAPAEPAAIPIAKPRPSRSLPPSMPDLGRPLGSRFSFPSFKKILYVGIAAGAAYGAYVAYPLVFDRRSDSTPPAPPSAAAARPSPTLSPAPTGAVPSGAPAPLPGAEHQAAVANGIAKGKRLAESGDYAGAVVAFNDAVKLDPANLDARAGLASAGAQYKAQKADQDAIKSIETAWAEGEYASGLRLAYRLPATFDAARVERIKAAGWYNLAIIALRAGDTRGALTNLDEALAIDTSDDDARKLKEFANRYTDAQKDRAFLDTVEAMPFRRLP